MHYDGIFRDWIEPAAGFYDKESDRDGSFVWSTGDFLLRLARPFRYINFFMCYYGETGALKISYKDQILTELTLTRGWNRYSLDLEDEVQGELSFSLDPVIPVPDDSRELGLMIREVEGSNDSHRARSLSLMAGNKALNDREFIEGKATLDSYPQGLRITLENKCNIKPPCVYCEWDWVKSMETHDGVVSQDFLLSLEGFYHRASEIVDCSYGEPLLSSNLREIIESADRFGKQFSMTSNGLLLDRKRQDMFLGKNVMLYVSLDAASDRGYWKYRNEKFKTLIANLKEMCARKKDHGDLPTVIVSFILMRSNTSELLSFLNLMNEIGVDGVKIRSLYLEGKLKEEPVQRDGFVFDYRREILDISEIQELTGQARQSASELNLEFYDDLEFGPGEAVLGSPLCSEPWKTIYVMSRGIMPCCYAKTPFVMFSELDNDNLFHSLRDLWNAEEYRDMRSQLAKGVFPEFCQETPSCPIVRRSKDARAL